MTVNIVGVSSATRTPNVYLQIIFGAGSANNASNIDQVVVLGHTNASGVQGNLYGPSTTTPVSSVQQAQTLFGYNCELTTFARAYFAKNKQNPLFFIPVVDSGTYSAYKLIYSGTTASLTNTINLWVNNQFFQIPIYANDSLSDSTISTRVANIINGAHVEFTAVPAAGSFTIISGSPGRRNLLSVQYALATPDSSITFSTTSAGYGVNSLATGGVYTPGNNGAVEPTSVVANSGLAGGMDSALVTLGANPFYHKVNLFGPDEVVSSWTNTINPFVAAVTTQATPTQGNRTTSYSGFKEASTDGYGGTYSTLIGNTSGTSSANMNNPRFEILWFPASDLTEAELLGTAVGAIALFEQNIDQTSALNFCGFGSDAFTAPYWGIPQPRSRYTESAQTIEQALESGLTVIGYSNGASSIVRRSTTRCVDASGTPNQQIADPHKVLIMDHLSADVVATLRQAMRGKVLIDSPIDSNDPIPQNSIAITYLKGMIFALLDNYQSRSLIQGATQSKQASVFVRDSSRADTIAIQIPITTIDIAAIAKVELDQVG